MQKAYRIWSVIVDNTVTYKYFVWTILRVSHIHIIIQGAAAKESYHFFHPLLPIQSSAPLLQKKKNCPISKILDF